MDFGNIPEIVRKWRSKVNAATQIIVCTPEYLHNIPAILKNSLEWLSSSGEMVNKPVLAITLTPSPPRGQYAMISLLNTLKALDAVVIAQLVFYVSELSQSDDGLWNDETTTLFNEQKSFLFPHFGKL